MKVFGIRYDKHRIKFSRDKNEFSWRWNGRGKYVRVVGEVTKQAVDDAVTELIEDYVEKIYGKSFWSPYRIQQLQKICAEKLNKHLYND